MNACRDWLKTQYRSSFKRVEFEVDEDTREGGRRIVIHEFPSSETWLVEDLGRKADVVSVTGYVHGDDADLRAQQLMEACASGGPGQLYLPLRPPVDAHCIDVFSTFRKDELGRIAVEMQFVYIKPPSTNGIFPRALLSNFVRDAIDKGIGAVETLFRSRFDTLMRRFSPMSIVPAIGRDAAARTIGLAGESIDLSRKAIRFKDAKAAAKVDLASRRIVKDAIKLAYQGQLASRSDNETFIDDQIEAVSGFSASFVTATDDIAKGASDAGDLVDAMAGLSRFSAQRIALNINALTVRAERSLTAEVAALVRRVGLLRWAEATTRFKYPSRPAAVTAKADLAVAFATEIETLDDPETERAMYEARNAAVDYLSQTAVALPSAIKLTLVRPLPVAVIATMLYDDANRDQEIIDRNAIEHPLYSPLTLEAARQ